MVASGENKEIIGLLKSFLGILRKNKVDFDKAYLYGSYSRGTATPDSDIDIAIIARNWKPDIIEAQFSLLKTASTVDSRIEPHPFRKIDFNKSNPLAREILRYGRLITA